MNKSTTTLLAACAVSAITSAVVILTFSANSTPRTTATSSQIAVVDFKELSQRLMLSMKDKITQSDIKLNPELIELMAQNEAAKLYKEVKRATPNQVVLNKDSLVHFPTTLDITSKVADSMGLEPVSESAIKEFMSGESPAKVKPVGVR